MDSENSTRKEKSFSRVFDRFAQKTSMQGIPYIHAATLWWSRLIWVVLTLTAIGAMTLHIYKIISQYNEHPVQTKVSLGFSNLQFPAMTICNVNVLRKSKLDQEGMKKLKTLVDKMNDPGKISDINTTSYPEYDYDESYDGGVDFQDKEDDYVIDQLFTDVYMALPKEVRKDAGHLMEDMIVSCNFAGRKCTKKNFDLYQTEDYGNCWTLNTTNITAKRSGEMGGLTLTLNLQDWEILDGVSQGYGAKLVVHEPGTIPFPSSDGILIASSFETNIGLRMVEVSRLGEPYSQCNDGNTFQKRYGLTYTRQSCQFMCIVDFCACYDDRSENGLAVKVNGTARPCKVKKDFECWSKSLRDYGALENVCNCLNPCNETDYVKTISNKEWPTEKYAKLLLIDVCKQNANACANMPPNYTERGIVSYNFLKLNLYFEDLNFEKIEEVPEMTISQFMSDLGGAIGLWTGLSVLAVCELFQLIIELFALCTHKLAGPAHSSEGHIEHSRDRQRMKQESRHHELQSLEYPSSSQRKYVP